MTQAESTSATERSEQAVRFVLVGGFLGAGKTTTLNALAQHYADQGKRVAIITNDQAEDLVDTESLRAEGHSVDHVAGSCFCCNFDGLMQVIQKFEEGGRPDVVLAEPVGSCTDLVATIIKPMLEKHPGKFEIAPFPVLLKPAHARQILDGEGELSTGSMYILGKQLEESDAIVLNQTDALSNRETKHLMEGLDKKYKRALLMKMSAKTGDGLSALIEFLNQEGEFGQESMEIDYDQYAAGEAELGWVNMQCSVESDTMKPFDMDMFLFDTMNNLETRFARLEGEVAHVKLILLADKGHAVANLTSKLGPPVLSRSSQGTRTMKADLLVNGRVEMEPGKLQGRIEGALSEIAAAYDLDIRVNRAQSFRPGYPMPTFRVV